MISLPDGLSGLGYGLHIHRRVEPREWPAALLSVPEAVRGVAEEYLRGVAACMRKKREMARECGCTGTPEQMEAQFEALRKEARAAKAPGAVPWVRAGKPLVWRNGEARNRADEKVVDMP